MFNCEILSHTEDIYASITLDPAVHHHPPNPTKGKQIVLNRSNIWLWKGEGHIWLVEMCYMESWKKPITASAAKRTEAWNRERKWPKRRDGKLGLHSRKDGSRGRPRRGRRRTAALRSCNFSPRVSLFKEADVYTDPLFRNLDSAKT